MSDELLIKGSVSLFLDTPSVNLFILNSWATLTDKQSQGGGSLSWTRYKIIHVAWRWVSLWQWGEKSAWGVACSGTFSTIGRLNTVLYGNRQTCRLQLKLWLSQNQNFTIRGLTSNGAEVDLVKAAPTSLCLRSNFSSLQAFWRSDMRCTF